VLYEGELVAEGAPDELTAAAEAGADSTLEDVFLSVTTESSTAATAVADSNDGEVAGEPDAAATER
jgi:ABC-2 type transport system ATP-binding protein